MKAELMDQLSQMEDDDFFELMHNMNISYQIRELMNGPNAFDREELEERLEILHRFFPDAINGAYEFTTRHMGVLKVLQDEKDFFDITDEEEEEDEDPNEVSTEVNYDIHDQEPDEIVTLAKPRELTEQELYEIERDDETVHTPPIRRPVYQQTQQKNPFEEEMNQIYKDYQAKNLPPNPSSETEFMDI